MFDVLHDEDMGKAIASLPNYNFHFAVRPPPKPALLRIYKPFTKGVIAAACNSNIIVGRGVDDCNFCDSHNCSSLVV